MPNSDMRAERTRRALADAMLALLKKNDFDRITVNDICGEAGVSRTTFYQYFEDKYRLAVYCLEAFGGIATDPDMEPREIFHASIYFMYDNQQMYNNLLNYDGGRELSRRYDESMVNFFRQVFEHKQAAGRVYDLPIDIIATYTCAGICEVLLWWARNHYAIPPEKMLDYLVHLYENNPYM